MDDSDDKRDVTKGWRPETRADCVHVPRPCPFVSCRFHNYLEVTPRGRLKLNWPELDPHELEGAGRMSCALDAATEGGMTLEQIGKTLNITRERVRQIEQSGKSKMLEILEPEKDDWIDVTHRPDGNDE